MIDWPLLLFLACPVGQMASELTAMGLTGTLWRPRRPEWTYFAVNVPHLAMLLVTMTEHLWLPTSPTTGEVVIGMLLTLVGIAIRLCGHLELAGWFSPYVEVFPQQSLVSSGMYAWVRHPMYLGTLLVLLGLPILLAARWAWFGSAVAAAMLFVRIHYEEAFLEQHLTGYSDYRRHTWRLVPYLS